MIVVAEEVGNDLGIGLGVKAIAFSFPTYLQQQIILDNTIVN